MSLDIDELPEHLRRFDLINIESDHRPTERELFAAGVPRPEKATRFGNRWRAVLCEIRSTTKIDNFYRVRITYVPNDGVD